MGWLRDLMRLSEPAMPSFGRLAETCLEHSDWPTAVDLQPRSLATLFSKLDRELDLDWLRDRVDVQRVICRVLGRPLGDVRIALGEAPALLSGRRLRLTDARFARELDLAREDLPPGIPERAYSPSNYQKCIWVAPPGAGKSLVGAWLSARGLAQVAAVHSLEDWRNLPRSGALFVEVARGAPSPEERVLAELLQRASPVCIASAHLPPSAGFEVFPSPPIASYLRALIDWLAARLDGTGHFVAQRAETWIRQVALPHRAVAGFGETLGLLGALDEFTPQGLRGKSLDDLASSFVERRLTAALVDTSWGPATATHAFLALGQAAARCLVEPGLDLAAPRTLEAWAILLAALDDAPDEEWLVRAMRLADDDKGRTSQMQRVARRLPPSGYRLARSLSLGGLLLAAPSEEVRADAELRLGPRWLVSVLSARANGTALDMSPSEWGAALLDPDKREELESALYARLSHGHFDPIEVLLDQLDLADPSHLAALDACLRQLADVDLMAEVIPDDLKVDLLARASEALVVIRDRPQPTLALRGAAAHRAALAALCQDQPLRERSLDPHRTESRTTRALFAADCAAIAATKHTELALAWLTLARALHADTDGPDSGILQLADHLLGERVEGKGSVPPWPDMRGRDLELALLFAARHGSDRVLEAAWPLLSTAQLDSLTDQELLHKLWLRAPVDLLPKLFARGTAIPWQSLLPHHYVGWLGSGARLPLAAAQHCPLEAVHQAVLEYGPGCLEADALGSLLLRSPRLAHVVVERLRLGGADLELLEAHYACALPGVVDALPTNAELLLWPRPALDRVRALLLVRIGQLGPRVDVATSRLRALEMALGPFRR